MRKCKPNGSFWLSLIINIILNFEGVIPAVVLLALHLGFGISVWWSAAALAIWIMRIIIWMLFMRLANKYGNVPDKSKENKNPYSVSNK